jgi:hypothetical protein
LRPIFKLFKANEEFNTDKWKAFKRNYYITSATIQVFLKAPSKKFFSSLKQTRNKNRSIEQLSPYAKEFFWIFLVQKKKFVKLARRAFFHAYNGMSNKLGSWLDSSWKTTSHNLKLGIIDFSCILNYTDASKSSAGKPYFEDFMGVLQR